jgi:hypothetical protein
MFMFVPPRDIWVFSLFFLMCVDCGLATYGRSQVFICVGWPILGGAEDWPADMVNVSGLVALL